MSDYKRLDDSGLSALVTEYFTKIKDKLENLGGLSNDAVATVEEETASKNYTAGDYFIKNDKLNVVKQNTTADTTWIKDENYEETSISEELNSINQKIDEIPRPSGTKQVTISQNGTTTEDVEDYENAQITVNVQPNLTTKNITQNGTYQASGDSVDGYSSVTVNVSGGADHTAEDALITGSLSGAYENTRITEITRISPFGGCTGLTSVNLPNLETVGGNPFNSCTGLISVSLPNLETAGLYLFSGCTNLTSVSLPKLKTSGANILSNCNSFIGILELPKLTAIANNFATNGYWKAIDVGVDVSSIGTFAFGNNTNATRSNNGYVAIRANSLVPASGTIIITGATWQPYFLVPTALVSSYKTATNWNSISSRIKALEDYTTDGTATGPLDPTKLV